MTIRFVALGFSGLMLMLPTQAVSAAMPPWIVAEQTAEHGGGCRKDSPPGQCCHAGSKPYHCH